MAKSVHKMSTDLDFWDLFYFYYSNDRYSDFFFFKWKYKTIVWIKSFSNMLS